MLEQNLVDDFVRCLPTSPFAEFGPNAISTEFDFRRGRTDIILLTSSNDVIAIEAKLEKWRIALDQAYRNTSFSHYSYVLLTEKAANLAIKHNDEFYVRNIGICFLSHQRIQILQKAVRTEPIQLWLYNRAKDVLLNGGKSVEC